MEKCKKRNMKHCTKPKFCAKKSRDFFIAPIFGTICPYFAITNYML